MKKLRGENIKKHQRKLNVPEFEGKIVKKEQIDTGKKLLAEEMTGKKRMRAAIK